MIYTVLNHNSVSGYDMYYGKYIVYCRIDGRKMYVKSYRDYHYKFTRDPLYAKQYTEKTAVKHLNRIYSLYR